MRLDRGETDYFLGSYTINLFVALIGAVTIAVTSLLVPAHTVLIAVVGIPVIGLLAVWLHSRSRLVWLAADLQFRPARAEDYGAATDSRESAPSSWRERPRSTRRASMMAGDERRKVAV